MKRICMLMMVMMVACALIGAAMAESAAEMYLPTGIGNVTNTVDLTPVINAGIALIGELLMAVVAAFVIPPVRRWMQAKMSKVQQEKTIEFIRQMVLAAEQMIGKGCGSEKLEYVIGALERKGFSVDINLIEAAVKEMNDRNLEWLFDKGADDAETDDPEA